MAAQMTAQEKLNPRIVTAARKNELCTAVGTTPSVYNRMAGMHQEARAAFKTWYVCSAIFTVQLKAIKVYDGSQGQFLSNSGKCCQ
jgi:hypothetical protein